MSLLLLLGSNIGQQNLAGSAVGQTSVSASMGHGAAVAGTVAGQAAVTGNMLRLAELMAPHAQIGRSYWNSFDTGTGLICRFSPTTDIMATELTIGTWNSVNVGITRNLEIYDATRTTKLGGVTPYTNTGGATQSAALTAPLPLKAGTDYWFAAYDSTSTNQSFLFHQGAYNSGVSGVTMYPPPAVPPGTTISYVLGTDPSAPTLPFGVTDPSRVAYVTMGGGGWSYWRWGDGTYSGGYTVPGGSQWVYFSGAVSGLTADTTVYWTDGGGTTLASQLYVNPPDLLNQANSTLVLSHGASPTAALGTDVFEATSGAPEFYVDGYPIVITGSTAPTGTLGLTRALAGSPAGHTATAGALTVTSSGPRALAGAVAGVAAVAGALRRLFQFGGAPAGHAAFSSASLSVSTPGAVALGAVTINGQTVVTVDVVLERHMLLVLFGSAGFAASRTLTVTGVAGSGSEMRQVTGSVVQQVNVHHPYFN